MSISPEFPPEMLNVGATAEFSDDEEALEALVQLKELDFGDVFNDRVTELDDEETEGLSISFFHDDLDNSLYLHSTSDSNVHINLALGGDYLERAGPVFEKVIENLESVAIDSILLLAHFDYPFNSLNLPLAEESEHEITGIKLIDDGVEYIIQAEEEGTFVSASWSDPGSGEDLVNELGQREMANTTEFIESFQ